MSSNELDEKQITHCRSRNETQNSANSVSVAVNKWVKGEISYARLKNEYFAIEAREILGIKPRKGSQHH